MKVWVLRHGEAQRHATTDAARELTDNGREQVLQSAGPLLGQPLRSILASPYARAQQTAELVRQALGFAGEVITVDWLTPDTDPREVLEALDAFASDEVLLVSHQPLVGSLVGLAVHGHLQQPQPMNTASLAELEGDAPLAGALDLVTVRHVV